MQKDAPDATPDLADDEIVDLLEVVKPGKTLPNEEKSGPDDVDFSKDLDAMLNELSKAANEKEIEEGAPLEGGSVDVDEKLRMPNNDDVDDLISSLGAELDGQAEEPEDGVQVDASPVEALGTDDIPVDIDDLPGIAPQAVPDVAADSSPPEDDDPFAAAMVAAMTRESAVSGQAPSAEDSDRAVEDIAEPEAPQPQPEEEAGEDSPAEANSAAEGKYDGVDLNELDALLDDVLAGAPASGRVASGAEEAGEAPAPSGEHAVDGGKVDFSPLFARLDSLDESLSEVCDKIGVLDERLGSFELVEQEFSKVRERIQALDQACSGLTSRSDTHERVINNQSVVIQKINARIDVLERTAASPAANPDGKEEKLAQFVAEAGDIKNSLEITQAALGDLRANLDKMAAEAAARVIREEIAALLQEG